jgi:hypothetical protein
MWLRRNSHRFPERACVHPSFRVIELKIQDLSLADQQQRILVGFTPNHVHMLLARHVPAGGHTSRIPFEQAPRR